jgi:hypothetical protein
MRTAEGLYEKLWGGGLSLILKEVSVEGTTWKYVPQENVDLLNMEDLGCVEERGLLFRQEYDAALAKFDYNGAMERYCGGVVVTGQPGIGGLSLLIIE